MALRSQRTNHVLHCEYTSTGENLPFLEEEYEIATENGGFQMNGRWSDNPIVLRNRAMPMEGRGLHSKGLTEDTLSVLRDGGNNGNEISKNS